jgi:universal stress protein A
MVAPLRLYPRLNQARAADRAGSPLGTADASMLVEAPFMTISRILVPVDFSDCSRAALLYACDLAKKLAAKITVLHVWDVPFLWPSVGETLVTAPEQEPMTVGELVQRRVKAEMTTFIADTVPRDQTVVVRLETGDPVQGICDAAARGLQDLVVIGTHGRTGISRLLAGSVAENVVRRCPVPVLTVRTTDDAPAKNVPVDVAA